MALGIIIKVEQKILLLQVDVNNEKTYLYTLINLNAYYKNRKDVKKSSR